MTLSEKEACRVEFEKWAANKGLSMAVQNDGEYYANRTQFSYEGWKASRANLKEAGEKEVCDAISGKSVATVGLLIKALNDAGYKIVRL